MRIKLDRKIVREVQGHASPIPKITDEQNIVIRKTYDSEYMGAEHTCDNEIEELGARTLNEE